MPIIEFKMPKMGESISEATIINWFKKVGDFVEAEETLVEVATDKVDSEIPAPFSGTITEIRFEKVVGCELSVMNCRLSVVGCRLSSIDCARDDRLFFLFLVSYL